MSTGLNKPMNSLSGIRAVSFDADGSLWDFQKVMRCSLGQVLRELENIAPRAASRLTVDKMIEIRDRVALELRGKVESHEEIRLEAFKRTLREVSRPDDTLATHLTRLYLRHRFEDIELFDDVRPTLEALRGFYSLGIVSNGNTYPERCGLEGFFRFVVLSQDHGVEKPDPRIFEIALDRAGCSSEELLHVGDSLETDIEGANRAEIRSVWLNRQGLERGHETKVDIEIRSLSELLDILGDR